MTQNIEALNAHTDHCNACDQCGEAAAACEPDELCPEGARLWEAFQELQCQR